MLIGSILNLYDRRWAFIVPCVISITIGIDHMIYLRAGELETMYPPEGSAAKASSMSIDRGVMIRVFLSFSSPLRSEPSFSRPRPTFCQRTSISVSAISHDAVSVGPLVRLRLCNGCFR